MGLINEVNNISQEIRTQNTEKEQKRIEKIKKEYQEKEKKRIETQTTDFIISENYTFFKLFSSFIKNHHSVLVHISLWVMCCLLWCIR